MGPVNGKALHLHRHILLSRCPEFFEYLEKLAKEGVESIAVSFLHSFANPTHERTVGDFIKKEYPDIYCSLSSEIMPEIREYERTSATAMNAYVQPITDDYLKKLELLRSAAGVILNF